MNKKQIKMKLWILATLGITSLASASIVISTDTNDFTLVSEEFAYTPVGTTDNLDSFSGNMSMDAASGIGDPVTTEHFYSDFADSVFLGNVYAVSGDENFDILFGSPQTVFSFSYEDNADISSFTLEFFNGVTSIGNSSFLSSTFNTEQFIAFTSDAAFNKVTIRESDGTANSNEYFKFYSTEAIPEPIVIAFVGIFGSGLWLVHRLFPSV